MSTGSRCGQYSCSLTSASGFLKYHETWTTRGIHQHICPFSALVISLGFSVLKKLTNQEGRLSPLMIGVGNHIRQM